MASAGYRLGDLGRVKMAQCFHRLIVVKQLLGFEDRAHVIKRHSQFHAGDIYLVRRYVGKRGGSRLSLRRRRGNRAAGARAQYVSGGDQDSLLFCADTAVERDGTRLDAGHPVSPKDLLTCHAVRLPLTRLGVDQTIVSMRVRR